MVEILIEAGAEINRINQGRWSALHMAAAWGESRFHFP